MLLYRFERRTSEQAGQRCSRSYIHTTPLDNPGSLDHKLLPVLECDAMVNSVMVTEELESS